MFPLIYFSWPPSLWMNWWRHHGNDLAAAPRTLSVGAVPPPPVAPQITPEPVASPEPDRVVPFPYERVNRRVRILARSAELIVLGAPRPA